MSDYVGQTTSFRVGRIMKPFKVERHIQAPAIDGLLPVDYLVIKFLDLTMEARVSTSAWDKQKKILEENAEAE